MRKPDAVAEQLKDVYYRLRRQSSVLRDGGDNLEGLRWEYADDMIVRKRGGWELRVYPVDDGVEVCLINPEGVSRTFA